MVHYFYPAVFRCMKKDGITTYTATMPNFPDVQEEGSDIGALSECLQEKISKRVAENPTEHPPIELSRVRIGKDEYIVLIEFDEIEYRRKYESRSIQRAVTLPFWLDRMAKEKNINFSKALRRALKEELGIEE